jgi:hypothetical protein
MRVPRWLALVLLGAMLCVPIDAKAAPIVSEQVIADPIGTIELTASFVFDNDIALFHVMFGEGTFTLTGASTSAAAGFDPILTLFDATGAPVPYLLDGAESVSPSIGDIDTDVVLPLYTLAGATTYTLAVSQFGPFVGNFPKGSLVDGFDMDADEFRCFTLEDPSALCEPGAALFGGQSGAFSFNLSVTANEPAPVPEPGTLALTLLGLSMCGRLRSSLRRNRPQI